MRIAALTILTLFASGGMMLFGQSVTPNGGIENLILKGLTELGSIGLAGMVFMYVLMKMIPDFLERQSKERESLTASHKTEREELCRAHEARLDKVVDGFSRQITSVLEHNTQAVDRMSEKIAQCHSKQ